VVKALKLYAGPVARRHLSREGLCARDVRVILAAAGGPKGLVLGPLDRFVFGEWLPGSDQHVDLVGASIGAWRMATGCLNNTVPALQRLEYDYIHQDYQPLPGHTRPTPQQISQAFAQGLELHYGGRIEELLSHPRYRLHVMTTRGRGVLHREGRWRTPLGYAGAYLTNLVQRRAMGAWLERVVFSSSHQGEMARLPFRTDDYPSRQMPLNTGNFMAAVQASCSIPFVLTAVHDIPGAPSGAYWDGGISDYHLHLDTRDASGVVLYPHFQPHVVPGWLDKSLRWRHGATPFLDRVLLLAPSPEWIARLPNGKLPDRTDFTRYAHDFAQRVRVWSAAASAAQQLADEFAAWLDHPDLQQVEPLP
jgi:hypothetical protein